MWMTFSPSGPATGGVAAGGGSGAAAGGAAGSATFGAGGCGARIREMGGRTGARASPVAPVPFRSGFSSINETDSGRAGGGVGVEVGLGGAGTGAGVEGAGFGSGVLSRGARILLIGGTPARTGLDSAAGAFFLGEMRSVATVRSARSAGLGGTGASGLFLVVLGSFLVELVARVAMNGFW